MVLFGVSVMRISMSKKTYEKPAIVHSEVMTTRATTCNKADAACTAMGEPIQS